MARVLVCSLECNPVCSWHLLSVDSMKGRQRVRLTSARQNREDDLDDFANHACVVGLFFRCSLALAVSVPACHMRRTKPRGGLAALTET